VRAQIDGVELREQGAAPARAPARPRAHDAVAGHGGEEVVRAIVRQLGRRAVGQRVETSSSSGLGSTSLSSSGTARRSTVRRPNGSSVEAQPGQHAGAGGRRARPRRLVHLDGDGEEQPLAGDGALRWRTRSRWKATRSWAACWSMRIELALPSHTR
jgi:hypothetical protein